MKKQSMSFPLLLSTICAVCLMTCVVSAQSILFSDDFVAPSVDTNKWTVTSFNGGFVTQGAGTLTLNNPSIGAGSFLTSTVGFSTPYTVTSSFLPDPDYAINGVILRASGAYNPAEYNDPWGLRVSWYFGTSGGGHLSPRIEIVNAVPDTGSILLILPYAFNVSTWNSFSVTDYGNSLSVIFNDVLVVDKLPIDITYGIGDKIILADGDNYTGLMESSSFGPVTVEAVPEPSTYALLLLSGAASLWALKHRKS